MHSLKWIWRLLALQTSNHCQKNTKTWKNHAHLWLFHIRIHLFSPKVLFSGLDWTMSPPTTTHHHPPPSTTIHHHSPPPTTSQNISTTTHHDPLPSTTIHHQPKYIHYPPPFTTTRRQPKYIHHHQDNIKIFYI